MNYPKDADGDALRRVAQTSDMSKEMDIDFVVATPSEVGGKQVESLARKHGYETALEVDDNGKEWTCYCRKRMIPSYDEIMAAQKELNDLSAPFGGHSDGWGTAGNGP